MNTQTTCIICLEEIKYAQIEVKDICINCKL